MAFMSWINNDSFPSTPNPEGLERLPTDHLLNNPWVLAGLLVVGCGSQLIRLGFAFAVNASGMCIPYTVNLTFANPKVSMLISSV